MMMTIRCEEEEEMKTKRRENERTFCPILLHIQQFTTMVPVPLLKRLY